MHKAEKPQSFKGSLADKAVQVKKLAKLQKQRPVVRCEGEELQNVFKFKYLGTIFAADGKHCYDIEARIAKAQVRCGQLRNIFNSPNLSTSIKLRLYIASVCSLLTYGSEIWTLNEQVMRKLRGVNSRLLSHITGRSYRDEARPSTTSFDLVRSIRIRRFRWLGHILRLDRHLRHRLI